MYLILTDSEGNRLTHGRYIATSDVELTIKGGKLRLEFPPRDLEVSKSGVLNGFILTDVLTGEVLYRFEGAFSRKKLRVHDIVTASVSVDLSAHTSERPPLV